MNWLYIGFVLAVIYAVWFGILLYKRKYNREFLIIGLSHIPYLLVNLLAPFRGLADELYAGYAFGWIVLPKGPIVTIVVGFIVVSSLTIASKAFLNQLEKIWEFVFVFDLTLSVMVAFPVLFEVIKDPVNSTVQFGEFLTISGFTVGLSLFLLFSGPTFYSTWLAGKKTYTKYFGNREPV